MKTALRAFLLLGISGWLVLAIIATAIFVYRDELRATRYWAMDRAAMAGDTSLVRFLLFLGADPTGVEDYKAFIKEGGYYEFTPPLYQASWSGRTEIARLLLATGATPHIKDADGWTPLLAAAHGGHQETALLLLEKGADSSARDRKGLSAAEIARKSGEEATAAAIERWRR
jgi:ankyrin repeat protein